MKVEPMDDGGMGSFRVKLRSDKEERHRAGRCAAELQFDDADGVPVLASLYLDLAGLPYEIDVWKANFQLVICIPDKLSF